MSRRREAHPQLWDTPDPPRVGHAGPNPPRVRNTDPSTSRDAEASLTPAALGAECAAVLEVVTAAGPHGATVADVLAALPGRDRGNTSRRVTDLRQAGHIVDSGRKRPGTTGRRQIVWVTTPEREGGRHP